MLELRFESHCQMSHMLNPSGAIGMHSAALPVN